LTAISLVGISASLWGPLLGMVVFALAYLALFAGLAHVGQRPPPAGPRPFFVFIVPCLNEELVIGRCLDKLLAMPGGDFAVLVIDDGSDDGTAAVVERYDPARVWLLRRTRPHARQGKGAALNAAYQHLWASGLLGGRDPSEVVVAVVDADGRLQPDALEVVAPYFRQPRVGAVQIGVRMYNARESLLARLQDIEFVVFTEIFQRARRRLGTVGLGGNGQFVRLAALRSLEDSPWTDCLTEDLDLGIRLRLHGWVSEYTGATWVEQQAVTSLPRLIRQRARWFQGHLQCGRRIPLILRAGLPLHTTLDLCWHLLGPAAILLMSAWSALFVATLGWLWATDPGGSARTLTTQVWILPAFYGLSMAPALLYGLVYRRQTRTLGRWRVAALSHVFIIYGYLWFLAGWRAVWQAATGRRGWAKTSRTADRQAVPALPPPPAPGGEPPRAQPVDWEIAVPDTWDSIEERDGLVIYWDPARRTIQRRPARPSQGDPQVVFSSPERGGAVAVRRSSSPYPLVEGPLRAEVAYSGQGYQRLRLERTTFKGHPAMIWSFVYRDGGTRIRTEELHLLAEGSRFVVSVWSPEVSWERMRTVLEPIRDSFELFQGGGSGGR
jgi:cellulose synthase/poly-beta-1,6-N-acetylglucosamine synthase-like glycosyltransferase